MKKENAGALIPFAQLARQALPGQQATTLAQYNHITEAQGLSLTSAGLLRLTEQRYLALQATGRVEFAEGILPRLVYVFCDSPYLNQHIYEETLTDLQDLFYHFKNDTRGRLSDDELLAAMAYVYNGRAQGDLSYLAGMEPEELCRAARLALAHPYHTDPTLTTRPVLYTDPAAPLEREDELYDAEAYAEFAEYEE